MTATKNRPLTLAAAALAIAATAAAPAAPAAAQEDDTGRWAFNWSVGWEPGGVEDQLDEEFIEAGITERGSRCAFCSPRYWDDNMRWGGGMTYSVGGWYALSRSLRAELQFVKAAKGWRNGYRSDIGYVELSYSSWSAAALLTYRLFLFTAGVGPAILVSDWREGKYDGVFFDRNWHPGFLADFGLIIVENENAYAGLQFQYRQYADRELAFKGELFDLGYQSTFFGMTFGTKF